MSMYETILWLQSEATGRRFPIAQFSADTDMVTMGWVSLTSTSSQEVVVTQMLASENSAGGIAASEHLVESRVNAALGRSDLRAVPLMRVEPRGPSAEGLSFQEFRKVCQSPRLLYRDIFVEGSLAERVDEVSLQDFESSGGSLTRYEA